MNKFLLALVLFVGAATSSGIANSAPTKAELASTVATAAVSATPMSAPASVTGNIGLADGVVILPFSAAPDNSGKAMVCAHPLLGICTQASLVTPERAVKILYPKATYLGFQLVFSETKDYLAIYYKTNQ